MHTRIALMVVLIAGCYVDTQPRPPRRTIVVESPPPPSRMVVVTPPPPQPPPPQPPPPIAIVPAPPPPQGNWRPETIRVMSATYGASCGAPAGNATEPVSRQCNDQPTCNFRVNVRELGDPAYGCRKNFVVEWRCRHEHGLVFRSAAPAEAGFGAVVALGCPGERYAQSTSQFVPPGDMTPPVTNPPPYQPPQNPPVAIVPAPPPPTRPNQPPYQPPQPPYQPPYQPPQQPFPPSRDRIQVVAGTYGGNCRARYGNATGALVQACNNQGRCVYHVDYHVLGDPAPGCAKEFVAEWRCGQQQNTLRQVAPAEAGYGSDIVLTCDGQQPPPIEPPRGGAPIIVLSGSYGRNCGAAAGNSTGALAQACNGRWECDFVVDVNKLGDPRVGCRKSFDAEWRCGQAVHQASAPPEAGFGSHVGLRCP
jgi:hypothetical protein